MAEPWAKYATPPAEASGPWSKYSAPAAPPKEVHALDLVKDFINYGPIGGLQGTAEAIRNPGEFVSSQLSTNERLFGKAKSAFDKGDYASATRHILNYALNGIPGLGAAMDEAADDFASGDHASGVAKSLGMASNLMAGKFGSKALEAATEPGGMALPDMPKMHPKVAEAAKHIATKSAAAALGVSPSTLKAGLAAAKAGMEVMRERVPVAEAAAKPVAVEAGPFSPAGPVRPPLAEPTPVPPEVAALPADITPAGPVRPPVVVAESIAPDPSFRSLRPPLRPVPPQIPDVPSGVRPAGPVRPPIASAEIPQSWIDHELPIAQEVVRAEVPVASAPEAPPAKLTPADIAAQELFEAMKESGSIPETDQPGIFTEAPRSMYNANGELKSAHTRAVEIENAHRLAKASRFAEVLKKSGLDAKAVKQIEPGRVSDNQMIQGMAPRWENLADHIGESAPSAATIQEIIRQMGGATKTTTAKMMKATKK